MSRKGQRIGSDNKSTMASNGRASAPPANAWSQPLRPKPNAAQGPPPGMGGKSRSPNSSSLTGNGNSASYGVQNALRERFIGLTLNMVGQKVTVTQTNGAVFEGIFHTFTPFNSLPMETRNKFVIKACRVVKPPTDTSAAADEPQVADQSTVIISLDKVACVQAKSMRIDSLAPTASNSNGASKQPKGPADPFRTDGEISAGKGGRNRDLVAAGSAWTTASGTTGGNSRADALIGALEGGSKDKGPRGRKPFNATAATGSAGGGLAGSIGGWDQFEANEKLFNVNATFDENLYTTELDKTQIDNRKIAEAERLAREIENTTSSNMHVAEERGHVVQVDFDEEDRYSGVLKESAVTATPQPSASSGKPKAPLDAKGKADDNNKPSAPAPPKKMMNYAAAAAKADTNKTAGPPGFTSKAKQTKPPAAPAPAPAPEEKPQQQPTPPSPEPTAADKESANGAAPSEPEPQPEPKKTPAPEPVKDDKPEPPPVEADKPKPTVVEEKEETPPAKPVEEKETPAPDVVEKEAVDETAAVAETNPPKPTEDNAEKPAEKRSSKLNANAKVFSLNAAAKSFTPGAPSPAPAAPDGQFVDPNAPMHVGQVPGHMPGHHYMHAGPMGHQPGMMPMMNPQFPGVRYPGYGMDQQHMPQMQPQPQHIAANPAQGSSAPSPGPTSGEEEGGQAASQPDGDAAATQQSSAPPPQQQQQQQPGQPQQPQQVPVPPYGVPPHGAYYTGMAMPPRPGAPHPGFHHPQYVGGPQQIPVGPGGAPYRHIYPMQPGGMAPNVQVRGPGGPYYGGPVAPMPYPHGGYVGHNIMDDDQGFRGGRGGGRGGQGRGRGRGRRSGRGGRGYNSYHQQHGGGRHSGNNNQNSQNMPAENWTPGDGGGAGAPQQDPSMDQGGKSGDKSSAKQ
ncbi:binding protein [Seminavis robusta]|uniref:Binding protein n=1 Tax=Seminavis robusta TaxID=568900 RepID=A0A9N8E681_9STRA|nr:binding protein [Seminavis robusta]|eukprot:Sro715_g191800.1 binding protein (904) ;mRNA; r:36510-39536